MKLASFCSDNIPQLERLFPPHRTMSMSHSQANQSVDGGHRKNMEIKKMTK